MNFKLITFDNEVSFWKKIVDDFIKINPHNIAASGGSSAQIFDYLSSVLLSNRDIYLVDERFVNASHQHANALLLKNKLLDSKKIKPEKLHLWDVDNFNNAEKCAKNYSQLLPNYFDLTLLGVGPDGHTASLFPNGQWLDLEQTKQLRCIATTTEEFAITQRLSLTYQEISQSKNIWILLIGKSKKNILENISSELTDYKKYPARKILDFGVSIYFLDN